jgi:NTP pyrophosphatase (non-canonical NTP hydrolase)
MNFKVLRQKTRIRGKEWKSNDTSLSFRGVELAGEVGEACNIIKKLERERLGLVGSRTTKEDLADELADVVICVELIAQRENINLEKAIVTKFNKTSEKYGLKTRMPAKAKKKNFPDY